MTEFGTHRFSCVATVVDKKSQNKHESTERNSSESARKKNGTEKNHSTQDSRVVPHRGTN